MTAAITDDAVYQTVVHACGIEDYLFPVVDIADAAAIAVSILPDVVATGSEIDRIIMRTNGVECSIDYYGPVLAELYNNIGFQCKSYTDIDGEIIVGKPVTWSHITPDSAAIQQSAADLNAITMIIEQASVHISGENDIGKGDQINIEGIATIIVNAGINYIGTPAIKYFEYIIIIFIKLTIPEIWGAITYIDNRVQVPVWPDIIAATIADDAVNQAVIFAGGIKDYLFPVMTLTD
jgi:hypothetical protein